MPGGGEENAHCPKILGWSVARAPPVGGIAPLWPERALGSSERAGTEDEGVRKGVSHPPRA